MTEQQALKRAQKLWGPKAMVSAGRHRSSQHLRDCAKKKLEEYKQHEPKFAPLEEWPGETTIAEYRRAKSRFERIWKKWRRERDELQGAAFYRRYNVGVNATFAFIVHGHGDTWEAAFADAMKKPMGRAAAAEHAQKN